MKKILVPFTAGLDSTYLVYKLLKEGNKVDTCYFSLQNNKDKTILEKIHRKELIKRFYKEFPDQLTELGETISFNPDYNTVIRNNFLSVQIPFWIMGCFITANTQHNKIAIAYVRNDFEDCEHPEINNPLTRLNGFNRTMREFSFIKQRQAPEFEFPIKSMYKKDILNSLTKNYKELVYTCENPKIIKNNDKEIVYQYCGGILCNTCDSYEKITFFEYDKRIFSPKLKRVFNKITGEFSTLPSEEK